MITLENFNYFFHTQGNLFFFSFYIHLIINAFFIRAHQGKFNKRFFEKFANSFLFLIAINLFLSLFSYYFSWIIYFLLSLIIVLAVIETNLWMEYKIFLTSDIFILLFETNKNETSEFLHDILSFKLLKNTFVCMFFLILCPIILTKFSTKILENELNKTSYYTILFLIALSLIIFLQAQRAKKRIRYYSFLPLFRIFREYKAAYQLNLKNLQALEIQKNMENEISSLDVKNKEIETLVFIIGESASKNYLEIYNSYASYLKNCSNMIKLKENGELFAFDDVISQQSFTALVIPPLLTFKNYENKEEWYECKNIISILKKAGYMTYWLSNQGKNETISRVFSTLADKKFFAEEFLEAALLKKDSQIKLSDKLFTKDGGKKFAYDELLINEGFKIFDKKEKKAIFIHLQGSHSNYSKRYPEEWNIDKIEDIRGKLTDKKKKYIAEYSNSLRYTDYILKKIFSYFSDEKSFFIYFSDHAEELWEKRDIRGHSSDNGSKYMIEIPFFIMMSKKLQEIYPNLVEACKKSIHKPYMTDDIIHTILGVLGINIAEYEEERNLLSDKFNDKRKRIYQEKDYESFWKKQFDKKS